ncbi:MAG: HEAT repeat domain-containing protein [Phycisphaerales bacterium]|nr:HEAT repeat domain-containing protein [Phycisphaerales bacterium]
MGPCATIALLVVGMLGLSGCIENEQRRMMAERDSILAPVFKQTTPAEAAAWAADPYDADKRARGMNLLANAPFGGADAYLKMYRDRLTDSSAPVRGVACRALGLHGQPEDAPKIAALTKNEEILVRLESTRALQRLHNKAVIPALIERLDPVKESEPEIRAEAASALGQYAETGVLQALIAALGDSSLLVNTNAHQSLRTITGNDELDSDRKAWVQWAKATDKPFANRRAYVYPVFWRERRWLDYVPFMPPVPNEQASTPAGFSLEQGPSNGQGG